MGKDENSLKKMKTVKVFVPGVSSELEARQESDCDRFKHNGADQKCQLRINTQTFAGILNMLTSEMKGTYSLQMPFTTLFGAPPPLPRPSGEQKLIIRK